MTMLDGRSDDSGYGGSGGYDDRGTGGGRSAAPAPPMGEDLDDDIPF